MTHALNPLNEGEPVKLCGYPAPGSPEKCERPAGHETLGKDGWHQSGRAQWRTKTSDLSRSQQRRLEAMGNRD